jgi:heme/copper-type cytochrome/quinol oxidase subunit 3
VTDIDNRKYGMWVLIASECFLFGTMITSFVINRNNTPTGPKPTDVFNIELTTWSTFILLMSSVFMVLALDACKNKQLQKFQFWTASVVVCGLAFLGCQVYEFNHFVHEGFGLTANLAASSFFLLTGCHGAHVAVGVLIMASILVTSLIKKETWFNHAVVETLGLYWHFVDVVWILIFTVVYLFVYL